MMKKIIMMMLIGVFTLSAMAQKPEKGEKKKAKPNVPTVVTAAFQKDYPNVKKVTWGPEKNDFEAEFKLNGIETSANYDKTGKRLEVETAIKTNELPKAALDYVTKNFPKHKITETAKIVDNKNVVTYEVEITLKGKSNDLIFNDKWNILTKGKTD